MQNNDINILVLGDSTFSSLGCCFQNALNLLCQKGKYSSQLIFLNPSAVGMTTADASIILKKVTRERDIHAVIIYLGNCDVCGYGFVREKTLFWGKGLFSRKIDVSYKKKNPLAVRNRPFQFVSFDIESNDIRSCVSPKDFKKYLSGIVEYSLKRKIKVFLLNTQSKTNFPPCNNMGNFIFYKLFGVFDVSSYYGDESADRLIKALEYHNAGDVDNALKIYNGIRQSSSNLELNCIALNNGAAIHFERGEYESASELLDAIPSGKNPLYSIALFNKAVFSALRNDTENAMKLFLASRESDKGSYRITDEYSGILKQFSTRDKDSVFFIDLAKVLDDMDFIDYCHPTRLGHEKIGVHLQAVLEKALELQTGENRPDIKYMPLNPDSYSGFETNFFEHFGFIVKPRDEFCRKILLEAESMSYRDILGQKDSVHPDPWFRSRLRILSHPIFGCAEFLRQSYPQEKVDQGRLPELYFLRHMLPLYTELKDDVKLAVQFEGISDLLPDSDRIRVWWDCLELGNATLDMDKLSGFSTALDMGKVFARTVELLETSISSEPNIYNKYRTMTYWFFRESLVFGAASHYSMLFDRLSFWNIMDTCLFVLCISSGKSVPAAGFRDILGLLGRLLAIHKKYLSPVAHQAYLLSQEDFTRYRSELKGLLQSSQMRTLNQRASICRDGTSGQS